MTRGEFAEWTATERLRPTARRLAQLWLVEGLDGAPLAAAVGLRLGAVRVAQHRLRARLYAWREAHVKEVGDGLPAGEQGLARTLLDAIERRSSGDEDAYASPDWWSPSTRPRRLTIADVARVIERADERRDAELRLGVRPCWPPPL